VQWSPTLLITKTELWKRRQEAALENAQKRVSHFAHSSGDVFCLRTAERSTRCPQAHQGAYKRGTVRQDSRPSTPPKPEQRHHPEEHRTEQTETPERSQNVGVLKPFLDMHLGWI
jgi:hypothetical protein